MHELTGPDDARRMVNFWADEGAASFKAYMNITRDELRAAVEEAHKRGMKVTGHLCSVGFKGAAEFGIDDSSMASFPIRNLCLINNRTFAPRAERLTKLWRTST